jgi:hypothetical protein
MKGFQAGGVQWWTAIEYVGKQNEVENTKDAEYV